MKYKVIGACLGTVICDILNMLTECGKTEEIQRLCGKMKSFGTSSLYQNKYKFFLLRWRLGLENKKRIVTIANSLYEYGVG